MITKAEGKQHKAKAIWVFVYLITYTIRHGSTKSEHT